MSDATRVPTTSRIDDLDLKLDRIRQQRDALKLRHAQRLTALMTDRRDLRGVHALADFVDDSVRWSA